MRSTEDRMEKRMDKMEDRILSKINGLRIDDLRDEVEEIEEKLKGFMSRIRTASTL
jgi:hypothetical protein